MTNKPIISLDAMGGDNAPEIVIQGAERALQRYPQMKLVLVGDEARLSQMLAQTKFARAIDIMHADERVKPEDKPSQALRNGKNTSMWQAIKLVADNQADAVVSAGNTGALMAMSKLQLRMMDGVSRPAIAGFFPTVTGSGCMLDMGANIECNEDNLVQFAIMGSAFVRSVLNREAPTIGLLNVGAEEQKGFEYLRVAASILSSDKLGLNYKGFVEGSDIGHGSVDVVVTDGFTGNVALKTAEGIADLFQHSLKKSFSQSIFSKMSYLTARPQLRRVRSLLDPRAHNGAVLLGLNGISVKSHGGTDGFGFANAIHVAVEMIKYGFMPEVSQTIAKANQVLEQEKGNDE